MTDTSRHKLWNGTPFYATRYHNVWRSTLLRQNKPTIATGHNQETTAAQTC